ncbi:ESPR domain-containing protein, partial [Caballeronia glebae]
MNNKLYKLVFNKTRGMMIAVADFATGHGGQGSSAQRTPAARFQQSGLILPLRAVALAAMLMLGTASTLSLAQIVAAPGSGAHVIQTQNGLNQVNIARP